MIFEGTQKERHTVPRWNSIKTAENLGELSSHLVTKENKHNAFCDVLDELLIEWNKERSLPLAIEIISYVKLSGNTTNISEVIDYACRTISQLDAIPPLLNEFLREEPSGNSYAVLDTHEISIEKIKKSLINYPRNPLLWCELAREYTILGQYSKSEKAIKVAYGLAPANRIILRSISRYYVHIGDIERALKYLRNSPILNTDPWILSAEIAISNKLGRTSKNIKLARNMLLSDKYSPLSISELASELGTMDFISGNSKQGKKKIELASIQPFENAVAQIAWINKNVFELNNIILKMPSPECSYEANTRWCYEAQQWETAAAFSGLWQEYQPFSKEPAMTSSFIFSEYLGDYEKAKTTLICGLKSNPNDINLLNNYAYSLILNNELHEARTNLEAAIKTCKDDYNIPLIATEGLFAYRTGDEEYGRLRYLQAIELAKRMNDQDVLYRAILCFAREEKIQGNSIDGLLAEIESPKFSIQRKQYQRIIDNYCLY